MFKLLNVVLIVYLYVLAAERFLESVERNQNYGLLLLHLMDKSDIELHIRVSAAIVFKNFIKRNWRIVSFMYFNTYLLSLEEIIS